MLLRACAAGSLGLYVVGRKLAWLREPLRVVTSKFRYCKYVSLDLYPAGYGILSCNSFLLRLMRMIFLPHVEVRGLCFKICRVCCSVQKSVWQNSQRSYELAISNPYKEKQVSSYSQCHVRFGHPLAIDVRSIT